MTRYLVVAVLFVLSLITYIDRAAIASAKGAISAELSFDDQAMGAVFSAFALGYALAQIPSGWFADRAGPRLMLAAVVTAWSVLTAATGAATTFFSMLAVRFLFGVAEAGAFPGSARAFYNWLPSSEHGRANGIIFSGSRLGAALAFPLMEWLLRNWNWRVCFYLLAIPGLLWALGWTLWFRNEPPVPLSRKAAVAADDLSFAEVFRSQPMLLAMAQYFFANLTTFLVLSWMLPYLRERYQLSAAQSAVYAMLPLLFGASSQWATGFLVDRLYVSSYRSWSRALPAVIGFILTAAGLIGVSMAGSAGVAVAAFVVAAFGADMTISPSWTYCMDIAGRRSGALTGSMNMMGNLGSFVSANAFPFLMRTTGTASTYFLLSAVLSLVAALFWLRMRGLAQGIRS